VLVVELSSWFSSANDSEDCLDVRGELASGFLVLGFLSSFLFHWTVLSHVGGKHLHHRPVVLGRVAGDAFQRVDPAEADRHILVAQLLDGARKALGYVAFLGDADLIFGGFNAPSGVVEPDNDGRRAKDIRAIAYVFSSKARKQNAQHNDNENDGAYRKKCPVSLSPQSLRCFSEPPFQTVERARQIRGPLTRPPEQSLGASKLFSPPGHRDS
jgi:hypothetical protein